MSTFVVAISTALPSAPKISANTTICVVVNVPCAEGRLSVRFILASTAASSKQFMAKLAPAISQMPRLPPIKTVIEGNDLSTNSMPINAVNTASSVTRGLVTIQ